MKRIRVLLMVGTGVVALGATAGMMLLGGGDTGAEDGAAQSTYATNPTTGKALTDNLGPQAPGRSSSESLPVAAATSAAGAPSSSSGASAAPPADATGGTLQGVALDRKIVFSASMGLEVKDVAAAFGSASAIARDMGGFVERSNFASSGGDKPRTTASLTIRVPAERYQDALASLRTLDGAKVSQEGSKATEVTEQYVDLQSRLRNLQQTENSYLKLLDQAKTIQEILTLNDRLGSVRSQIEQIQGRLNVMDRMTELAAIDVSLAPFAGASPSVRNSDDPSFTTGFADAWDSALSAMRHVAAGAGMAAVAAIWLVVPLGLVGIAAHRMRRRHTRPLAS